MLIVSLKLFSVGEIHIFSGIEEDLIVEINNRKIELEKSTMKAIRHEELPAKITIKKKFWIGRCYCTELDLERREGFAVIKRRNDGNFYLDYSTDF